MIRVGQKLHETRVHKALTLEEIAVATKIRPNFLAAIETGEYEKLPSAAYIKGFVRNYAAYLGLSQKDILALYRREFNENKQVKVLPDGLTRDHSASFAGKSIHRSLLFFFVAFLGLTAYLGFQYRAMLLSPALVLDQPKENSQVKKDIVVSGKTDPNVTVLVNGTAVSLNSQGEFKKQLTLFSGKNSITIQAKNRFGKETVLQREVIVTN